ncbi:hypothetical protein [Acrocarpospora catenulata]|uniref:hypothetical protein n=1 Tax=Acrocarpospora catenulata TaxID=2836182 RepID=UPI001BDAB20B|nr:hypothetical protein [Acrocarpospora catenulata]
MNPPEHEELARLLPPPTITGLPGDRHRLLKDNLMTHLRETPARPSWRGPLLIGVAAPLTIVATVFALFRPPAEQPAAPMAAASRPATSPAHLATAEAKPKQLLKLTVHSAGKNKIDFDRLVKDLDAQNVNVTAHRKAPKCAVMMVVIVPKRKANGDFAVSIPLRDLKKHPVGVAFTFGAPKRNKDPEFDSVIFTYDSKIACPEK